MVIPSGVTPPALGQVPQGEQPSLVHALVMGDGQRHGQAVGTTGPPAEQLEAELRPRVEAHNEAVIENRQSGWLEHDPTDLGLDM
jgi:hypothetical protein